MSIERQHLLLSSTLLKHYRKFSTNIVWKFGYITCSQKMVSCVSSRPEFFLIWLSEMLASELRSLWESSSFLPCLVPYALRDVCGANPEWPWNSGFTRKLSDEIARLNFGFPSYWIPGITQFLCYSSLIFLKNLSDIVFLGSGSFWVLCQVTRGMVPTIFFVQCC